MGEQNTDAGADRRGIDVSAIARDFTRVRRGYDPAAVDHHLALVTSQVKRHLEREAADPDESLDLVLKATRRSVDEALSDARGRAEAIVAVAESEAADIEARAAERCRALDAEGRERYAEIGRLTEVRAQALAEIEERIVERQLALHAIAAELVQLAAGLSDAATPPVRDIAAMTDPAGEIVLPARPGKKS